MLVFLVYHKIEDRRKGNIYTVCPDSFFAHLSIAQQGELPILNPHVLSCSKRHFQSGLIFTFDDGTIDHFQIVRPFLMEFGIEALFYVSTAKLNRDNYLTSEQVRLLWEEGHTIGSHSHTHQRLDLLPPEQIREELELSAIAIENIVGRRPVHLAPPGGFYSSTVQEIAQQAGYAFCRTMDWGYNRIFDPIRIEVVPMTEPVGPYFINCAIHGRLEWTLKVICTLKNGLRASVSKSIYGKFRAMIDRFGRRS